MCPIDIQRLLVEVGALKNSDHRLRSAEDFEQAQVSKDLRGSKISSTGDEDDDWD